MPSDMILTKFLRDHNIISSEAGRTATAHGFRSSFRSWASENGYPRDYAERERKLEGATAHGLTVYGTKYQLENDPFGERIDDPLTPQDERYDCGDFGNCYFDHNTSDGIWD